MLLNWLYWFMPLNFSFFYICFLIAHWEERHECVCVSVYNSIFQVEYIFPLIKYLLIMYYIVNTNISEHGIIYLFFCPLVQKNKD